jgi:hypothetical protein
MKVEAVHFGAENCGTAHHQQTCNLDGLSSGDVERCLQDGWTPFCFVIDRTQSLRFSIPDFQEKWMIWGSDLSGA